MREMEDSRESNDSTLSGSSSSAKDTTGEHGTSPVDSTQGLGPQAKPHGLGDSAKSSIDSTSDHSNNIEKNLGIRFPRRARQPPDRDGKIEMGAESEKRARRPTEKAAAATATTDASMCSRANEEERRDGKGAIVLSNTKSWRRDISDEATNVEKPRKTKQKRAAALDAARRGKDERKKRPRTLRENDCTAFATKKMTLPLVGTGENSYELYCLCRSKYDPKRVMIGCDRCHGWFHPACINLPVQSISRIDHYICPLCIELEASAGSSVEKRQDIQPIERLDTECNDVWKRIESEGLEVGWNFDIHAECCLTSDDDDHSFKRDGNVPNRDKDKATAEIDDFFIPAPSLDRFESATEVSVRTFYEGYRAEIRQKLVECERAIACADVARIHIEASRRFQYRETKRRRYMSVAGRQANIMDKKIHAQPIQHRSRVSLPLWSQSALCLFCKADVPIEHYVSHMIECTADVQPPHIRPFRERFFVDANDTSAHGPDECEDEDDNDARSIVCGFPLHLREFGPHIPPSSFMQPSECRIEFCSSSRHGCGLHAGWEARISANLVQHRRLHERRRINFEIELRDIQAFLMHHLRKNS